MVESNFRFIVLLDYYFSCDRVVGTKGWARLLNSTSSKCGRSCSAMVAIRYLAVIRTSFWLALAKYSKILKGTGSCKA
jgi:hypothetical protein